MWKFLPATDKAELKFNILELELNWILRALGNFGAGRFETRQSIGALIWLSRLGCAVS